jgi:hypothetical protein
MVRIASVSPVSSRPSRLQVLCLCFQKTFRVSVRISAALLAGFIVALVGASTAMAVEVEFESTQKFRSGSLEAVKIENKTESINCTESESTAGEFKKGTKASGIVLKFKGCKKGAVACETALVEPNVITTNALGGQLAYQGLGVRGEEKPVFELFPEAAGPIASFTCGAGNNYALETCIPGTIAKAGNPGPKSGVFSLTYKLGGVGKQEIVAFSKILGGPLLKCFPELKTPAGKEDAGVELKQTALIIPCPNMDKIND